MDFHLVEQGCTLRFATFLHSIDQTVTRGITPPTRSGWKIMVLAPLCNYSWGRAPVP